MVNDISVLQRHDISVQQRYICITFQSYRSKYVYHFSPTEALLTFLLSIYVNFCPISKKGSGEIEMLAEPLIRAPERYLDRVIAAGQADRG